ncbi:MAG: NAD(P)-dependent oxidoreductase [Chloroflexota bacterium]
MKILITGASGKLGAFVIQDLVESGYSDLVLLSRSKPDEKFAQYHWIEGDLNDFSVCQKAVEGVDSIQHLGAQPWPVDHPAMRSRAEDMGLPFDATFKTNMLGTYYLMQAAVEADVQTVVMAGSNCALGHGFRISDTPFPFEKFPIDEAHPCHPEDSYSLSKNMGEDLLAGYSRAYGIRTYVTRICGICPPDRRKQMAENVQPVTGWSDWLWCWVGSEDVASAHRLLMEASADLPPHDIYYLNGDDTSVLEPTADLVNQFQPTQAQWADSLSGNASLISNAKLKGAVGWRPKTSWRKHLT